MDLQGIPKKRWRAGIVESYRQVTGKVSIPSNQYFFTLGGPCAKGGKVMNDSEYDCLTSDHIGNPFIQPHQYVSVERNAKIHRENCKIKGPTWLQGNLGSAFESWYNAGTNHNPAIISADLMCGVEAALPTMIKVFDTCERGGAGMLIVFNMLATNRWRVNQGGSFKPVMQTVQANKDMQWFIKRGHATLLDRFQYENKTVGMGSGISVLETLTYWFK
jgi:hypothetical protein